MNINIMPKRNSKLNIEIGKKLSFIRKAFQMSQGDVAEILGVTAQQIYKYETGQNSLASAKLAKLSKFFGCSMDFFLSSEDGQKDDDVLQVSEKSKTPFVKKRKKNNETIEMLKAYLKLSEKNKKKIRDAINSLVEK